MVSPSYNLHKQLYSGTDAMVTIKQKCEIHEWDNIYSPVYSQLENSVAKGRRMITNLGVFVTILLY